METDRHGSCFQSTHCRFLAVAFLAIVLLLFSPSAFRWWNCRFDVDIAQDAERVAVEYLVKLTQSNHSFASQFGSFSNWNGKGHTRPRHDWLIIPRLEMTRRAFFSKATLRTRIYVIHGPRLALHRIDFWPKGNRAVMPWDTCAPSDLVLDLWISHPKFQHVR